MLKTLSTLSSLEAGSNTPLKRWNNSDVWEQTQQIKIAFTKKLKEIEINECLLKFGAESFVFQSYIQKYKDQDIRI
jgi:hypothetical protein